MYMSEESKDPAAVEQVAPQKNITVDDVINILKLVNSSFEDEDIKLYSKKLIGALYANEVVKK